MDSIIKKTVLAFFFLTAIFINLLSYSKINISTLQAQLLSQRIFINETDLRQSKLLQWNKKENFLSLGIAHFIWYPQGQEKHFVESFPLFLTYLQKQNYPLPIWLSDTTACPWSSSSEFYSNADSTKKEELYKFLRECRPQQTNFLVSRLQLSLPKILSASLQKEKVKNNIKRLSKSMNGIYAMLDYVNFKGEGLDPKESRRGKHWGLLQVLEIMDSTANTPAHDFAIAAKYVLNRRVKSAPYEKNWLAGWNKRLDTYYE